MVFPGYHYPVAHAHKIQWPMCAGSEHDVLQHATSSTELGIMGELHTCLLFTMKTCFSLHHTFTSYRHTLNCSTEDACLAQYQKWLTMSLIQGKISDWFLTVPA